MGSNGPVNKSSNSGRGPPPPMNTQYVPEQRNENNPEMYSNRPDLNASMNNNRDASSDSRPEMKGPDDINDILNGLKAKSLNRGGDNHNIKQVTSIIPDNDSSTISITELKKMQIPGNIPKRTMNKRRKDKNVISLTEI
jgi:hypothetical protein